MKSKPRTPNRPDGPAPTLDGVLIEAAQDVFSRLVNKYLPERSGYVGDDASDVDDAPAVDPHRVLGLPSSASASDIKRRVRQLAKVFHPDVAGGDADKMAEINDAARVLLKRAPSTG